MALTKRFAVIQGPPGTGKTYVGLKIARVLLQSSLLWQNEEQYSPILMVSYTNHALDEFLGGLPTEGKVTVDLYCYTPPMWDTLLDWAKAYQVICELARDQVVSLEAATWLQAHYVWRRRKTLPRPKTIVSKSTMETLQVVGSENRKTLLKSTSEKAAGLRNGIGT